MATFTLYLDLDEKEFSRTMRKLKKKFDEPGFERYLSYVASRICRSAAKTTPVDSRELLGSLKILSGRHWRDVGYSCYYATWVETGHHHYVFGYDHYWGYMPGQGFFRKAFNRVVPRLKNIKDFAKW